MNLAVFHPEGLAGREDELAAGDVHLPAAKVGGVQPFFDAGDDLARVFVAAEHVGVGHARQRQAGVAFAPAIAGGLHPHQAGVQAVLHIAFQDAVFNQHIGLGGVAFVVDVERAAPVGQGAIVQDGHALGGDALADAAAEGAGAFAVEVALQPVAHGFVQQHAGPASAQHYGHFAGRGRAGIEVGQGLAHGLAHVVGNQGIVKVGQAKASTAAR